MKKRLNCKAGQKLWHIGKEYPESIWEWGCGPTIGMAGSYVMEDCFLTAKQAEAECDKRNKKISTMLNTKTRFTIEDLRKAFSAGRTVCNYKGEREEVYKDDYTSAKYEEFEDWLKEYTKV